MPGWVRRTFGTLRWKLAASYVAVTLLVILTLELILLAISVPVVTRWIVPEIAAVTSRQIAQQMTPAYRDPGRTPQSLGRFLRGLYQDSPSDAAPAVTLQYEQQPPATASRVILGADDVHVLLFDANGAAITGTQELAAGQSYESIVPPAARPLIVEALNGATDTRRAVTIGDGVYFAAAPVLDADARPLGAILLLLPAIPSGPIVSSILTLLLISTVLVLLGSGAIGLVFGLIAGRGFSRRLKRLTAASAALAAGDLSRRVEDRSADEIGQLARQFNAMADQLADNLRALRLLADQNAQLAESAGQLAAVEERNRLARDLHDSVSQELFSLTMLAAAAKRQLNTRPDAAMTQLDEIQATAKHALEETRSLIFALRPAMLDGRGLAPALRDLAAGAADRQGLIVDLRISGERRLPLEQEQALFRIAQEALANVVRHSGTRRAEVVLEYTDDATRLMVRDEGHGFDPAAPRSARSLGIISMTERVESLGGTLAIWSTPGAGTTVTATLPRDRAGDLETRRHGEGSIKKR